MNPTISEPEQPNLSTGVRADGTNFVAATRKATLISAQKSGLLSLLTQWVYIVDPGLVNTVTRFKGLKRPLLHGQNMNGDKEKEVHCWKPGKDYEISRPDGFALDDERNLNILPPPPENVFFVILTPNSEPFYPNIDYWVHHWGWVPECPKMPNCPLDWENRYDIKL